MLSISDRICALLAEANGALPVSEVVRRIGGRPMSVYTALTYLTQADDVTREQVGRHSFFFLKPAQREQFDRRMAPLLPYFQRRLKE